MAIGCNINRNNYLCRYTSFVIFPNNIVTIYFIVITLITICNNILGIRVGTYYTSCVGAVTCCISIILKRLWDLTRLFRQYEQFFKNTFYRLFNRVIYFYYLLTNAKKQTSVYYILFIVLFTYVEGIRSVIIYCLMFNHTSEM